MTKPKRCHDCGAVEGALHELGCDMERCPFCGGQLITCSCAYEQLGYDYDWSKDNCGLPQEIYENGLPDAELIKWESILEKKGRVPYICYPLVCGYCGELWPGLFMVDDEEWQHYIQISKRDLILCRKCYDDIKAKIDANAKN